jgi:Planctomycete cytochrome C
MKTFSCIIIALALARSRLLAADKWDISKLDLSKLPPAADKTDLTYDKDIRPLLQASCLRCHGEERAKADLRLDSLQSALAGGKDGKVVIPGESKKSLLVAAAAQVNNDVAMPPKRGPGHGGPGGPGGTGGPGGPGGFGPPPKALTAEQVALIRAWIDQGAK